jgi:5-methylcytosine-specific restriction protein A
MPMAPPSFRPIGTRAAGSYESERRSLSATRKLYSTARWRAKRAAQLRAEPLCRMCRDHGIAVEAAVADHVTPHRGDVDLFWSADLQSLCTPCHSSAKQRQEARQGRA